MARPCEFPARPRARDVGSDIAGEIKIYAIDDAGHRYGPVSVSIDAKRTRHFNSYDLEYGAPSKGLFSGVGDGTGMWRLELETTLKVGAKAYIRTPDGFVTGMHQVAEEVDVESEGNEGDYGYYVPFFNPASNTAIRSLLRVINPNPTSVFVTIFGIDDDWHESDAVFLSLAPNSAIQVSSQELEQGGSSVHRVHWRWAGQVGDCRHWRCPAPRHEPALYTKRLSHQRVSVRATRRGLSLT